MKLFLLPGLQAKRNLVRLGSLVLKLALFLPLPVFCQSRAVSSTNVPFGFSANGKALPAGEYLLYRDADGIYSLRTRSGLMASRFVVYGESAAKLQTTSKLVFRGGANGYYLESFWIAGSRDGMRVVTSRRKRDEVAARGVTDTVMVASTSQAPLQP